MREGKALGHDSDHGRWGAIHPHSPADDCRILCVPSFPETVAQDGDPSVAWRLVGRREIPPDNRVLANQLEGIGTDFGRLVTLRKAALIAEDDPDTVDYRHSLERLSLCPPVLKIWI